MPERPSRRLRFVRALEPVDVPAPREEETAASILPGSPRVGALDALLREVDDLRLTLETDLTLAAAAVEAGGTSTASEIIEGDLESLHSFEVSAMGHLAELAATTPTRKSRWASLPTAPFVAAAAVIGLLLGVVPHISSSNPSEVSSVSAQSSLQHLTTLAAQGRTSEVRVAALTLHDQISALVDSSGNAATAQQALLLLSYERNVIVQSGDSAALHDVLLQSAALTAKIRNALPQSLRTNVPPAPAIAPVVKPEPKRETAKPRATSTRPAAKPSPTASPKPSPTASPKPKPTPSPSPSASPTSSPSSDPSMPFLPAGSSGSEPTPPPGSSG